MDNVLIPLKLDAFIFNKEVCDEGHISGKRKEYENRQGVYLHWTLPPRVFRNGIATMQDEQSKADRGNIVSPTPEIPYAPTRWLVVRWIAEDDLAVAEPVEARIALEPVTAWVVESDREWELDRGNPKQYTPDQKRDWVPEGCDMQVDVTPFINANVEDASIKGKSEVFIGDKTPADRWVEDVNPPDGDKPKAETRAKERLLGGFRLLSSSNELFPDYQPHNSNVLSLLDRFEYSTPGADQPRRATAVTASYAVIGWYSNSERDIVQPGSAVKRSSRLQALNMMLKGQPPIADPKVHLEIVRKWLESDEKITISICHAFLYDLKWDAGKLPPKVPADRFAELLHGKLPVSVGTTPLDSLLAHARAHKDLEEEPEHARIVEEALKSLEIELLAGDDDVETRDQASDILYNWNYLRTDGGGRFYLTGPGGGDSDKMPNLTNPGSKGQLSQLNDAQQLLDATRRELKHVRWQLFAEWWKSVASGERINDKRFQLVDGIKTQIENLQAKEKVLEGQVEDIKREKNLPAEDAEDLESELGHDDETNIFKAGIHPPFYQPRDPTLLVGGIRPSWEHDYLDPLPARLDSQLPVDATNEPIEGLDPAHWDSLFNETSGFIRRKMPRALRKSVKNLLQEFVLLKGRHPPLPPVPNDPECPPKDPREDTSGTEPSKPVLAQEPLFHDGLGLDPVENTCHETVHYGIKPDVELAKVYAGETDHDMRRISGRSLILPKSTFSLKAKLEQLFASTPATEKDMDQSHRTRLLALIRKFDFLSAPLSGLGANMLTTETGGHTRPAVKDFTSPDLHFIPDAAPPDVGFTEVIMPLIREQTGLTPYDSSHLRHSDRHSALKTVSHGQFKFTKINIVDKFGQTIHAIDPTLAPAEKQPTVRPCISECGVHGSLEPKEPAEPLWHAANEWDQPIWGWIVINYPNSGLQFFLPDGTFYREVRLLAGPEDKMSFDPSHRPLWLPSQEPDDSKKVLGPDMQQLSRLVKTLAKSTAYLGKFIDMVQRASSAKTSAPGYAEFGSALTGRPLALTYMAWSLELAGPEWTSQMDGDPAPSRTLLPPRIEDKDPPQQYSFPIQIGDEQLGFDGLVGYFLPKANGDVEQGDALDLTKIYSHFATAKSPAATTTTSEDHSEGIIIPITSETYPKIRAHYIAPSSALTPAHYAAQRDLELQLSGIVAGALVDPFLPCHAFTAILPPKELSLPPWTWQNSLARMATFFNAGPLLISSNVPSFNPENEPMQGSHIPEFGNETADNGELSRVVSLQVADMATGWAWLEPYTVKNSSEETEHPQSP
ncbi:hypothetical protein FMUND_8448 [Fusarium mundagurra]|uniref:Uncharacterized protein n=1 Tax=Fusarium mundagurra TaxID=1567541 RepID=A0A8H5YHW1_9HYPO|nr:hypothetical protein FMUND_8448 [Fusarium mundagurra]